MVVVVVTIAMVVTTIAIVTIGKPVQGHHGLLIFIQNKSHRFGKNLSSTAAAAAARRRRSPPKPGIFQ